MNNETVNEKDWKLFRKKIIIWQENYIAKLNDGYISVLTSDASPEDKFRELERRINRDKRSTGVSVDMRRSAMFTNLVRLISDGVITPGDLEGFSDEIREKIDFLFNEEG